MEAIEDPTIQFQNESTDQLDASDRRDDMPREDAQPVEVAA